MRVLPFTIPSESGSSFTIQLDKVDTFYPYLHRHEEIQICWIKKGHGTLIVQAELFPFQEDDIFIIASNCAHLFKNESNQQVEYVSIFFNTDPSINPLMSLGEMQEPLKLFRNIAPCNILNDSIRIHIENILQLDKSRRLSVFIEMLTDIQQKIVVKKSSLSPYTDKSGDRMKKVMEYSLTHLNENIDIKTISQQINYTPEAFCRFFKKRTGKTFVRYLNELRINEACRLILNKEITEVSKIAYDCGFNNVSHFNRVFKQIKGCAPLQFKKAYLANVR